MYYQLALTSFSIKPTRLKSKRHWLTLWLTDLKNSKTELSDLSNYVQMAEKTSRNAINNESNTFTMKISMKIVFIFINDNNSSTEVNGADILGFHFFEALNDNFEA